MKAFIAGVIFLAIVLTGGYIYLKYYYKSPGADTYTTAPITKTGQLQVTNVAGSDFTHVLLQPPDESIGVSSFTIDLNDYVGKQVSITGQYSGNTLYADSVNILP